MESFFRYISYVDYYKKGEKIKNVGFLRWKLHNNEHRIELQIKDVSGVKGNFEIKEKNTGKVIGQIKIDQGIGNFINKFPSMTASDEMYIDTLNDRLYLSDIEGFLVQLNTEGYLSVDIKPEQEKKTDKFSTIMKQKGEDKYSLVCEKNERDNVLKEEQIQLLNIQNEKANKSIELYGENTIEEQKLIHEKDYAERNYENNIVKKEVKFLKRENKKEGKNLNEAEAASENILIEGIEEKYIEQKRRREIENCTESVDEEQEKKYVDSASSNKKIEIIEPIHGDKWQQLCSKYQQVHPFPNKRVFLSIKPEDFIVLQQGYQKLVHNSFLLHGFYNYGHMILGKLTDEKEAPVYIGVPGVYYEREKQAAQMFGFAGFESTEHPVQAGSYGYYMIEVEL